MTNQQEANLVNRRRVIGEIIMMEKYRFVDGALIASIVEDTIKILDDMEAQHERT